ncbi:MAG TPA: tetratricopeptide repeat protein [Chthoniobacteraceae bacterium]|nr:tetratricopeptide repeat protein [Chthoniobacteraceae bacterium]
MPPRAHADSTRRWRSAFICASLVVLILVVFRQTAHFGFVNLDDDLIVTGNPNIYPGLTAAGVLRVFTHFDSFFYTPLTSISHMLDCSLYGHDNAGGPPLINVLLHAAAAIALFLALQRMTGAPWRSAFVAAVFAVHPLHVESVAWISERKDVLSGLFFMLTLLAYARYAEKPSRGRYLPVVALFIMALLSKPVVVTLPFVLLLLDYWPLRRTEKASSRYCKPARLLIEKIPLFLLSAAASVVAVFAEHGAIQSTAKIPVAARLGNALVSCAEYIVQMFHPVGLCVFYPHPGDSLPAWEIATSFLGLTGITGLVFIFRKTERHLVTGWLWYLGMLVPVSGLVQVGIFARADRFTYLSQIGLYLMGTWAASDWFARRKARPAIPAALAGIVLAALATIAWAQTTWWQDSISLWTHALACTTDNYVAEQSLGSAWYDNSEIERASGNADKAKADLDKAEEHLRKSLGINPHYVYALHNLGDVLLDRGDSDGAIEELREAAAVEPRQANIHNSLGFAYYQAGRDRDAISEYEQALALNPDFALAWNNLAWMLATSPEDSLRDGPRALALARRAYAVSQGTNPKVTRTLAAAFAETSDFADAIGTAQAAKTVAAQLGDTPLSAELQTEIDLYTAGKPFRHKEVRSEK